MNWFIKFFSDALFWASKVKDLRRLVRSTSSKVGMRLWKVSYRFMTFNSSWEWRLNGLVWKFLLSYISLLVTFDLPLFLSDACLVNAPLFESVGFFFITSLRLTVVIWWYRSSRNWGMSISNLEILKKSSKLICLQGSLCIMSLITCEYCFFSYMVCIRGLKWLNACTAWFGGTMFTNYPAFFWFFFLLSSPAWMTS